MYYIHDLLKMSEDYILALLSLFTEDYSPSINEFPYHEFREFARSEQPKKPRKPWLMRSCAVG